MLIDTKLSNGKKANTKLPLIPKLQRKKKKN